MAWADILRCWDSYMAATKAASDFFSAMSKQEQDTLGAIRKRLQGRRKTPHRGPLPQTEWDAHVKPLHDRYEAEKGGYEKAKVAASDALWNAIHASDTQEWPRGEKREVARYFGYNYRTMGEYHARERAEAEVLAWEALGFKAEVRDGRDVHPPSMPFGREYVETWHAVWVNIDTDPELAKILVSKIGMHEWLVLIWDRMRACNVKCLFGPGVPNWWDSEAAKVRKMVEARKA